MITWPTSQIEIPFLIAGPRSVTAVFAQICFYEVTLAIDLAGLSQIHLPATDPSCSRTSSKPAHSIVVGLHTHALSVIAQKSMSARALAAPPPDISRGFLPWRLSDAGLGPSRSAAIGRHPKPSTEADVSQHYSISSSASTRMDCGTTRPSVFAVLMLMTSSNLVGRSTGMSFGLVPRKTFPPEHKDAELAVGVEKGSRHSSSIRHPPGCPRIWKMPGSRLHGKRSAHRYGPAENRRKKDRSGTISPATPPPWRTQRGDLDLGNPSRPSSCTTRFAAEFLARLATACAWAASGPEPPQFDQQGRMTMRRWLP